MQENKKRLVADDYSHLEDIALKSAAQFFGEELLPYLGIYEKVTRVAPTELVHLEARKMYEDFNFIMDTGEWYHFEFESDSISRADLRRFREYEASTSRMFNAVVVTCVVCSAKVKNPLSELKEGLNTYRVKIIKLKEKIADYFFTELEKKAKGELEKRDLLPIILSPLMDGSMSQKDRILKGLEYLKGTYRDIGRDEQSKMQAILYAFAVKFLAEPELNEVKEAIAMTVLGQMLVADGIQKGIAKGIEKGIEVFILDNLEEGNPKDRILEKLQKRFELDSEAAAQLYEKYAVGK